MTLSDAVRLLIETTLATCAATLLVLALRRPLRALCGSRAAYALWALVPAAGAAVLLPGPVRQIAASGPSARAVFSAVRPAIADIAPAFDPAPWALALWAAGVCLCILALARKQFGFVRGLGALHRCGEGLLRAETSAGLPAVIGLRPKIVLPADFDSRYEDEERRLILAHERIHAARGDMFANLAAAAMRCLYWFNPLLHFAADRFRRDQELACDETVIARHPQSRRAYGQAMLKTQLSAHPVPLACHWFGSHPLKERIAMLKLATPSTRRWISGTVFAVAATLAGAYGAWAAQPPEQPKAGTPLTMGVRGMPVAEAARQIAARAGLRIVNPEVFPAGRSVSFDFTKISAEIALGFVGEEIGYRPEIVGSDVRFVEMTQAEREKRLAPPVKDGTAPAEVILREPAPEYPAAAQAGGQSGRVDLRVLVGADGRAKDIAVKRSEPAGVFDEAAVSAAKRWRFKPQLENGKAVDGYLLVPIEFRLSPPASVDASDRHPVAQR